MNKESKASMSHHEAVIRELRANPEFAVEYLKAALEDADESETQLIALRRVAEAHRLTVEVDRPR